MSEKNFDLNDCVCFLTSKASKTLSDVLEKRVIDHGVTRVQWIAMYYINQGNNLTQKQLSVILGIKEPTVVRLIDRCEKEELVKRVPSETDGRKKVLILTEKGKELNEFITKIAGQFMIDAIEGISMEELNTYKNVIRKMIENFDKCDEYCCCCCN